MSRWVRNYTISCLGLLAFIYLALWAFNDFHGNLNSQVASIFCNGGFRGIQLI